MARTRIYFDTVDGKIVGPTRQDMAEVIAGLPDGKHCADIHPTAQNFTATRYKYYFDCVMWECLCYCGHHYRLIGRNGDLRPPRDVTEMHDIMKIVFNPVTVIIGSQAYTLPGSTTELSDKQFIDEFTQKILELHAGEPYYTPITMYEDWRQMRKDGTWREYKGKGIDR